MKRALSLSSDRSAGLQPPVPRARQQRLCAPASTCVRGSSRMRWDQVDLTDDDCAGSKVAPRQTLPASKPPPPKVRWRMRWGSRCDGQSSTKTQARRRLGGRTHPPGPGAISQGASRRGGARKRDRRAPRVARGPVRFAARAARPHRQRLARADDRGLKSMTGESRPVAGRR